MSTGGKNSQIFHFRIYSFFKMPILGQILKKFENSSNFVTLKISMKPCIFRRFLIRTNRLKMACLLYVVCFCKKENKSSTLLTTCSNN